MYDLSYTRVLSNGTTSLVGDASPMENFFLGFGKFGLSQVIRRKNSQLDLPKRVTVKDKIHFVENGPNNPIVNITYQMCELKYSRVGKLQKLLLHGLQVKKLNFFYADQSEQEVSSRYFKNENCTQEQSLSPPSYCFGAALTSFDFVENQLIATWSCGVDRYYEEVDCTNDHFQRLENTYRISISVVQSFFEDVQNSASTWLHN